VTEIPEEIKIKVFKNGIIKGLKGEINLGGNNNILSEGFKEKLIKAQKNETKNISSEVIKSIIPIFNPFLTFIVCIPSMNDSFPILDHHINEIKIKIIKLIGTKIIDILLNILTKEKTKLNEEMEAKKGQGFGVKR
jgi:hypothetical protein